RLPDALGGEGRRLEAVEADEVGRIAGDDGGGDGRDGVDALAVGLGRPVGDLDVEVLLLEGGEDGHLKVLAVRGRWVPPVLDGDRLVLLQAASLRRGAPLAAGARCAAG